MCAPLPAMADAAHGIAIQLVQPGREGLELSARLTAEGGPLQQNISWHIRSPDGVSVYSGDEGTADVSLPPGDYVVDASYGATLIERQVSLPAGTRLKVNFVLDAGGLKVEPMVGKIGVPPVASRVRVFSMDGRKLMAVSVKPGEIIRLPEGSYRVESQVSTGSVVCCSRSSHIARQRSPTTAGSGGRAVPESNVPPQLVLPSIMQPPM